jgi:hypothetical protein
MSMRYQNSNQIWAKNAALPKLRSDHAARWNNFAI